MASLFFRLIVRAYGIHPKIEILGDTKVTVPVVIDHLRYIITEILKNACRATVEHARAKSMQYSPSNVLQCHIFVFLLRLVSDFLQL